MRIEVFKVQLRAYENIETGSLCKMRNNPANELFTESSRSIFPCNYYSSK